MLKTSSQSIIGFISKFPISRALATQMETQKTACCVLTTTLSKTKSFFWAGQIQACRLFFKTQERMIFEACHGESALRNVVETSTNWACVLGKAWHGNEHSDSFHEDVSFRYTRKSGPSGISRLVQIRAVSHKTLFAKQNPKTHTRKKPQRLTYGGCTSVRHFPETEKAVSRNVWVEVSLNDCQEDGKNKLLDTNQEKCCVPADKETTSVFGKKTPLQWIWIGFIRKLASTNGAKRRERPKMMRNTLSLEWDSSKWIPHLQDATQKASVMHYKPVFLRVSQNGATNQTLVFPTAKSVLI